MDIVERVAAAISASMDEDFPAFTAQKWDSLSLPAKQSMMKRARAAIAAMREPTEWMLIVGQAAMPEHDEPLQEDALATWRSMIDKALE